jgi:hypothetical protein
MPSPQQVPDLTSIRDIKLNSRVSLRKSAKPIAYRHRTLPSSGSTVEKPSVDYIPAGDLVLSTIGKNGLVFSAYHRRRSYERIFVLLRTPA